MPDPQTDPDAVGNRAGDPTPNRESVLATQHLHIPAQPEQMSRIYGLLARFDEVTQDRIEDGMVYPAFMTAVVEIATNIIRHAYAAEAEGGELELALTLYENRLEARFCDQGAHFESAPKLLSPEGQSSAAPDPETLLNALDDIDNIGDLPEGGFGLMVARQALDRLEYLRTEDGDNCWLLVKEF